MPEHTTVAGFIKRHFLPADQQKQGTGKHAQCEHLCSVSSYGNESQPTPVESSRLHGWGPSVSTQMGALHMHDPSSAGGADLHNSRRSPTQPSWGFWPLWTGRLNLTSALQVASTCSCGFLEVKIMTPAAFMHYYHSSSRQKWAQWLRACLDLTVFCINEGI